MKRFSTFAAVEGVDLAVRTGEIFGVLGPDGAGKTNTLKMLATLLPIDGGRATIFGVDVAAHPHQIRQLVGVTGQYASVDKDLTGQENLWLFGRLQGLSSKAAKATASDLLTQFGLEDAANRQMANPWPRCDSGSARTQSDRQPRQVRRADWRSKVPAVADTRDGSANEDPGCSSFSAPCCLWSCCSSCSSRFFTSKLIRILSRRPDAGRSTPSGGTSRSTAVLRTVGWRRASTKRLLVAQRRFGRARHRARWLRERIALAVDMALSDQERARVPASQSAQRRAPPRLKAFMEVRRVSQRPYFQSI